MPRRFPLLIVPLSLTVLATLAGCGGEEPLSRAEYVKQADAICARTAARGRELGDVGDAGSVAELERITATRRRLAEQQLEELRALKAPGEIAETADDAYELQEGLLERFDEVIRAAKDKDSVKLQQIGTELVRVTEQSRAKIRAIGLKVCGAG